MGPDSGGHSVCRVDTGSQSRAVMRAKLEAYRRYRASGEEQDVQDGVFPLVVIVTSSPERQAMLLALLTYLPTEDWQLFKIGQLADAARLLMGGASKWLINWSRPPPWRLGPSLFLSSGGASKCNYHET
jgi:hypothetical protein